MLSERTDKWIEILRKGGASAEETALDFFCREIVPGLMSILHQKFSVDPSHQTNPSGHYDGLISVLGFTPDTVILATRFAQPDQLAILHTKETHTYLSTVRRYVDLPADRVIAEEFDKSSTEDLYRALNLLLARFDRKARVALELTGGTKPMGGALQIAAAVFDIDAIYIDYDKYIPDLRKPRPESVYIRLMENPLKTWFNLLRPVHLGTMAAAATHELNQPVGIIRAAVQAMQLDLKDGLFRAEELEPFLDKLLRQANRMSSIIDTFRRFERGTRAKHDEIVQLNEIIEHTARMFARDFEIKHKIAVKLALATAPEPKVLANAYLIEEVLINLLSNARDALTGRHGAEIIMSTFHEAPDRCGFSVADNGPGLPADYRNLLFIPFISTKSSDQGRGLGLFTTRRILDDLGGRIAYSDRLGGGACFRVEFPCHGVRV